MAFIVVGMSAAAIAMAEAAAAATLAAATTGGTLAAGAGGLGLAATAGTAGTLGATAGTLGTAAELATAAEVATAAGSGGMMPTATALSQGAATGLAPGVGAGGVTAPGVSSLSAAGLETGNALSRGLTQFGEILSNPYVQGGIGVAEGGRTYAETGDLGESFMAGLGAWGMAGAAGGLSSFAGRKLGQTALSQGSKQVIPAINQIDNSIATGLRNPSSGQGLRGAAGEVPNVGQNIGTDARAFTGAGTDFNMYGGVPQVRATNSVSLPFNSEAQRFVGTGSSNMYPQVLPGATPLPPRAILQTPSPTGTPPVGATTTPPASAGKPGWFDDFPKNYPGGTMGALATGAVGGPMLMDAMQPSNNLNPPASTLTPYKGPYLPTERTTQFPIGPQPWTDTSERQYFNNVNPYPGYIAYDPNNRTPVTAAAGGLMGLAGDSYDDGAGQDGYADGGEVDKNTMATPDMSAIQQYVQSISQPQRPQVPEILRQLQAQHDTQAQTPVNTSERNYGFKPITVQVVPPAGTAETADNKLSQLGVALAGGSKGGASGAQSASVDPYAAYRPVTMTTPGADPHEYQYTDTSKYVYNPETQQMEIPLAVGGLTSLARGGRYLDGPGDGLSDSISATIGNRQPARLADGEFVISADVVSAIGGGSSKAGAKKLHAMMDRVRQSAHGTKKQVRKINDRKVLAA